ncbi:BamA/TamA family outer membrane protein [Mucilaginibacter sp. 21P]|uniref:BamA/TamA family outer membrane protein n=1 Tax=Mucilaginibacter sp. 21P TaxID=2778902 RepID=UPI001C595A81|nr:BamA/TamA family outer membrane protein [Mucilaginibacter sp. 21P]QXV64041.1 BamA/TamA family outer membrane protein [Mucilaginibacter sp. 21P]
MYKLLAAAFLCLLTAASHGQNATTIIPSNNTVRDTSKQTDLIDIYRSIFKPKATKPRFSEDKTVYFSILPFGGQVPGGTGKALITSTTAGIYLGPRQTTNISSATFTPYLNFRGRFGLPLRTSVWLPNNEWTIQGDTRFLVYPQYTWGLGSKNGYLDRTLVDYKYIRFYQSVLKQIKPYLFAGVGYNMDYRINVRSEDPNVDLKEFTSYNYGVNGNSFSSGVTLNLLYDTRNNSINPLPGAYANIVYRVNPKFLGSQENWTSIYIDVRKYVSMNPGNPNQQNTLAFWSYLWKAFSSKTPYLDLPSIGWDPYNRSARGIDQNRYRGRTLLYFETEYRRDITRNGLLGFVLFSNINTVSGSKSLFTSWHPAAGTGLRVKFNKGANTNVGIDYGFSQGYRAIMLNLGEAF